MVGFAIWRGGRLAGGLEVNKGMCLQPDNTDLQALSKKLEVGGCTWKVLVFEGGGLAGGLGVLTPICACAWLA